MINKSSAEFYPFKDSHKQLFEGVVFLVEATSNEQQAFWSDWFYKPKFETNLIKDWQEMSIGNIIEIGRLDNRPVNIAINWAFLEGYRVMFYDAVSQVVDYKMVEDWIKHFSFDTIKWDNGHRWAHCDSSNFHLCISAIKDLVKENGIGKSKRLDYNL